ncbi:unnamed protein product [Strongylus vulgaris]|uniref:Uncharacterized protein n=1 Tax=Strongylus vulgaris TaxID=40348 RepID=A0A3P7IL94_STRVU|nr:unnamed protein product [Strongylus vulgaris]
MSKESELDIAFDNFADLDLDDEVYRFLEGYENQWSASYQVGQCVSGCFSSVQHTIGKVVFLTILQRLIGLTGLATSVKHFSCISLGALVLVDWIPRNEILLAFLPFLICLLLVLLSSSNSKGFLVTFTCISSILLLQHFMSAEEFVAIRGILMVLTMKISSLAFDMAGSVQLANAVPMLAYLVNPGTLVFGPFHAFQEFEKTLIRKPIKVSLF